MNNDEPQKKPHNKRSPKQEDVDLGFRIMRIRQARKISQEAMAKALEISRNQYRKNESGLNRISGTRLNTVAKLLGVTIDELMSGVPPSNSNSDLDQEFNRLWNNIKDDRHKATIVDMMKIAVNLDQPMQPEDHKAKA